MTREAATGYSTFEVTLPQGVNEQTMALYGLGNALGWNIKERVAFTSDLKRDAIPEYMEVSPEDLRDISSEIWGTDIHGESAANFLEEDKNWLNKYYYVYTYPSREGDEVVVSSELKHHFGSKEGEDRYSSTLGVYSSRLRSASSFENQAEAERIEQMIGQLWPRTPFPFEAPTVRKAKEPRWKSDDGNTEWWDLEPGPISRARLAHHARISGKAWHSLHGSIGKALDVINVAAGLTPKEVIADKPADPDMEFVDYDEFRAMLKNSGLTRHAQDEIRKPIEWSLEEYIRSGKAKIWLRDNPELVVDGKVEWVTRGGNRVPHPERIARVSLAHLLDKDPSTRNVAPREFLAQFT